MLLKLRFCVLALGLAGLVAQSARTQDVKVDPIIERMRKDVTYLASDELEGRGVGTKGLDLAADYIADQFKKAGLKPGGVNGTYFQPFPFSTSGKLDGESSITLVGPDKKEGVLKHGTDFQVMGTSAAGKLTAPVVFVGYGVTARGIEYNDYAGIDVKGKIVVALRRLPRWNDKAKPFDGVNRDKLAGLETKQFRAQNAKAAAVILVNDATEANDTLIPFATLSKGLAVSIPFVHMKRSLLDHMLRESAGKKLEDIEKAIDEDLKPRSVELKKWSIALDIKVQRTDVIVKNVIGYVDGKGALANEIVVVGGHYDHLGFGGPGSLGGAGAKGKIHHGADDNGSGTTTVLELARRFGAAKNPDGRKMVFMTFTAEERGLIGSRHYCENEPLFPLKDTAAMFNLDMVGRIKPNSRLVKINEQSVEIIEEEGKAPKAFDLANDCEFYHQVKGAKEKIAGGAKAEVFKKIPDKGLSVVLMLDTKKVPRKVVRVTLTENPRLLALGMDSGRGFEDLVHKHNTAFHVIKDTTVFGASDHYSFFQQKIPVLFFWTGTHPDYHRPTDTADKINVLGMKQIADYSERIIDDLRTTPKRPEYAGTGGKFNPDVPPVSGGGVRIGFRPSMQFEGKGVLVDDVSPGGPAEKAGLKKGDVIIELAGKSLGNLTEYQTIRLTLKADVAIDIKIVRDGKEMTLKVTPAK